MILMKWNAEIQVSLNGKHQVSIPGGSIHGMAGRRCLIGSVGDELVSRYKYDKVEFRNSSIIQWKTSSVHI